MSGWVPNELRQLVAARAGSICEYCLIHESDTHLGCEVDHIISEKHDGPTVVENLAYACFYCNRHKGSDVASINPESGEVVRLFNPLKDVWSEHFQLRGGRIEWRSRIGEATARLMGFNLMERMLEREALRADGKFPCAAACERMR
ncbi:MAG: HNH endonuclease [Pedosphaera sp.]|nr:HNH endonuclease [Pedosphaera sp.]